MAQAIEIAYSPREQFFPFHQRNQRWACIVAHRRAGKTVACVNDIIARAIYSKKKNPQYAYIAPFYRQAKDTAWVYFKEFTSKLATRVSESELRIELPNKAKITLYGADNPDALRGIYLDGCVLDEFGDCRPSLWGKVVLPTLADRNGWAVFIGTPKGMNHFHQIYKRSREEEGWFNLTLRASETHILKDTELKEMRRQMTQDEYDQEFECSFEAAVLGSYYGRLLADAEKQGRINNVFWDPEFPVEVATDLGYSDSTAFWFWQHRPDGIAIIDYEEDSIKPLSFYFEMLRTKGYKYSKIWLPHDARAKTLQTGRSTVEQFLNEKFPIDIAPNLKVQHGIDAARFILPHCHFNRANCDTGLEALRAYSAAYNEVTKAFSDKPAHNWASNGADAFRYLALVAKTRLQRAEPEEKKVKPLLKSPEWRLEDLYEERERKKYSRRMR